MGQRAPCREARGGKRLTALCRYLFAGGAENCRDCEAEGAACAKGGRVRALDDDPASPPEHLCPQWEHAPQTLAGQRVFDVVWSGGALRTGFNGVEGVDTAEALRRLPDLPQGLVLELLDAAEQGVLAGVIEARDRRRGGEDNS